MQKQERLDNFSNYIFHDIIYRRFWNAKCFSMKSNEIFQLNPTHMEYPWSFFFICFSFFLVVFRVFFQRVSFLINLNARIRSVYISSTALQNKIGLNKEGFCLLNTLHGVQFGENTFLNLTFSLKMIRLTMYE